METEPYDLEDYLFRIHFREEEIERVMEAQDRKMFDELIEAKFGAVEFARIIGGVSNRIDLGEFVASFAKPALTRSTKQRKRAAIGEN